MSTGLAFKRILAPVDFSACSEHALRQAFEFAQSAGARLHVLHVWEPSPYVSPTSLVYLNGEQRSFWDHIQRELRARLTELVDRCRGDAKDVPVEIRVEAGYTSDSILSTLESEAYDLVVMGTHGRKWLAHVLLGSVAARVVRHAPCPVLTVRLPKEAPQKDEETPTPHMSEVNP